MGVFQRPWRYEMGLQKFLQDLCDHSHMADALGYACIALQKGLLPWSLGVTASRKAGSHSNEGYGPILSVLTNTF